jgi:hypothetical protein
MCCSGGDGSEALLTCSLEMSSTTSALLVRADMKS